MALKDHLNKFEYFCAVVEYKSILKASYNIGVTQPQLSRVVKQLEEDLEKQLLVRTPSGIEPTKDGLSLYKTALEIINKTRDVEKTIKYENFDLQGEIKIGTYDSIARYFFPSFLKYLKATLPKLTVHLETARSSDILKKVNSGQLDIGVCVDDLKPSSLIKEQIYNDSFGFYHHPSINTDFNDQLIFFPESVSTESTFQQKFLKKYKFKTSINSDNLETVKSLSEEAVGVGLLPHRVAREAVIQGKLVELKRIRQKEELFAHSIVLSRNKKDATQNTSSLILELTRFLSSWSKN